MSLLTKTRKEKIGESQGETAGMLGGPSKGMSQGTKATSADGKWLRV